MKSVMTAIGFGLAVGVGIIAAQQPAATNRFATWIKFNSPEGGFSVELPEKPTVKDSPFEAGPVELLEHVIETDRSRDRYFRVSYVDVKNTSASSSRLQDAGLTELIEGELKRGGSLQYRLDTGEGSCKGKEASLSVKNSVTKRPELLRVQTFSSGDRVYLVMYRDRAGAAAEPDIGQHFFDTFAVTGGCRPRWFTFTTAEGGFTAKFPEQPNVTTEPLDQSVANELRSVIEFTTAQGRHFEVSYVNFLGGLEDIEWAKNDALTRLIDHYTAQGGKLLGRDTVSQGDCHGLQATLRIPHPVFHSPVPLKVRVFASYKTIYLVYYAGHSESPEEDELADEFLNSFSSTNNCHATANAKPARSADSEVEIGLDPTSGWQRVVSPLGIKFLMPQKPVVRRDQLPSTTGERFLHLYADVADDHVFTIEVIDVRPNAPLKTPAEQNGLLLSFEEPTIAQLSHSGIRMGAGTSVNVGPLPGREYPLTPPRPEMTGRLRLVITPTRLVRIMAMGPASAAGREQMARFIDSIVIDPK